MTKVYNVLSCLEFSQVDQYTSGDPASRIVEMVFRKAVIKRINLSLRNSTASASSKNKPISTESIRHPSSSKSRETGREVEREEGQTSKQKVKMNFNQVTLLI